MINNPNWQKSKIKPYLHQLSLECIEEITVFMEGFNTDEIEDEELLSYIAKGNVSIRILQVRCGLVLRGTKAY